MLSAWINAFLGSALVMGIGTQALGFTPIEALLCIVGSNVGGFVALILILQLEWRPWIKRHILNRSRRTWPVFLFFYYGITFSIAPHAWGLRNIAWLWLPMALSNGFCILAFGPVQDWLVARNQRKTRKAALSRAAAQ